MIVCVCHRISHKTIEQCALEGGSFEHLKEAHGVATQCGQCETVAHAIWTGACARRQFKSPARTLLAATSLHAPG